MNIPFPRYNTTRDSKGIQRIETEKSGLERCIQVFPKIKVVYYESIMRELKIRPMYEYRCDERLKTKSKEFTRVPHTGLLGGLEHLKIETRLIDEKITNAMGEYVT